MQLTWKASESTSAFYTAQMLSEGFATASGDFTAALAATFAPAIEVARAEFEAAKLPTDRLFAQLTALSAAGAEDNRRLIEQAIAKTVGPSPSLTASANRLASTLGGLRAAFLTAYRSTAVPNHTELEDRELVDELLLRGRPLMEQWEARGPGLLAQIRRSLNTNHTSPSNDADENLLVEYATITLVYPILGGHGLAHRSVNTVTFEAVLTNPDPSLPETLRLAWLLAQLNLDLPKYSEHLPADRRELLGQLALLPPVLAAAEFVELAHLHESTLAQAITTWRIPIAADPAATATTLLTWWHTLQDSATPWPVALAALDQMLDKAASS
jgi:hypothetical protein